MKEHPILFSTPMVQELLDGKKTQTRRTIKRQPVDDDPPEEIKDDRFWLPEHIGKWIWLTEDGTDFFNFSPYGKVGDILWVRETWRAIEQDAGEPRYEYRASETINKTDKWRPNIFMPRAACRLRLGITKVRVERLQDISEEDARCEGAYKVWEDENGNFFHPESDTVKLVGDHGDYKTGFKAIWKKINGIDSWNANPWVWAINFEIIE